MRLDFIQRRRTIVLVAWGAASALVFVALWRYETSPGPTAEAPVDWPDGLSLERTPGVDAAILFIHPRCPCSTATIEELALGIQMGWHGDVHVVMYLPDGEDPDWARGERWDASARIPGVRLHIDPGGRLAWQFHALTSGHMEIFDGDGRLKFAGGLTPARGSTADGRFFQAAARGEWNCRPVFGCSIFAPETCVNDQNGGLIK